MGWIRAAAVAGAVAAGLASGAAPGTAWAEGPGRYQVQGTNPDGSRYSGTAVITAMGQGTWRLNWTVGGDNYSGFAIGDGSVLAVSYVSGGTSGVGLYTARSDGSYAGIWAPRGAASTGSEVLIPR